MSQKINFFSHYENKPTRRISLLLTIRLLAYFSESSGWHERGLNMHMQRNGSKHNIHLFRLWNSGVCRLATEDYTHEIRKRVPWIIDSFSQYSTQKKTVLKGQYCNIIKVFYDGIQYVAEIGPFREAFEKVIGALDDLPATVDGLSGFRGPVKRHRILQQIEDGIDLSNVARTMLGLLEQAEGTWRKYCWRISTTVDLLELQRPTRRSSS